MKKNSKPAKGVKGKRSRAYTRSAPLSFSPSSTSAELIRQIRGGASQQEFARSLGVSRTAVSGWEIGNLNPPPEIWMKLGNWAHPDDSRQLWHRAGIDLQVLDISADRHAKRMYSHPAEGEIIEADPIPTIAEESAQSPSKLKVPQEWVSNPALTKFLRFEHLTSGYGMAPGDILIVDTSDQGAPDLLPFWRKRILLETDYGRPIEPEKDPRCTKIWVAGSLNLVLQFSSPKRFHWGAMVQPWTDGFHLDPVAERDEKLTYTQNPLLVGNWECEAPSGLDAVNARGQTGKQALRKLHLDPGQRILGRVIGWLHPPQKSNGGS